MSGRIIFELLSCEPATTVILELSEGGKQQSSHQQQAHFVRINVDNGIVALPGCEQGPGSSCPLEALLRFVRRKGDEVGRFGEVCGLEEGAAKGITFLHLPQYLCQAPSR